MHDLQVHCVIDSWMREKQHKVCSVLRTLGIVNGTAKVTTVLTLDYFFFFLSMPNVLVLIALSLLSYCAVTLRIKFQLTCWQ
ncbi:hypothetical protein GDO78_001759 [Eleutherodactylus coqui]|uniref:Uncharacterized protein n=1 Tax=Eleutherodactylus coqui TaxID=57060 RepID=A0A8J6KP17_ELECQ|nr:hypothetical protein GDO78_001759 [Eleutherodactylus coqui]